MSYLQGQDGRRVFYYTCIVIFTLFAAYLIYRLNSIVVVLFSAILFASTIRPIVEWLTRFRIPRVAAIIFLYIVVLGSLFGLLAIAVPPLINLIQEYSVYLQDGRAVLVIENFLQSIQNSLNNADFISNVPDVNVSDSIENNIQSSIDNVAGNGDEMVEQALPFAQNTIFVLSQILLALVMSFYWLTSREKILDLLLSITPTPRRHTMGEIWNDVEFTLGSYVRAQTLLSLIIGVVAYTGLRIFDVRYPLALATISALLEFIPVVGPILGAVPAVLVAFEQGTATGFFIGGWYLIMQQIEGNILVPKLMERSVGINPLLVLVALVAGSTLSGVLGALLALPVVGALQVVARHVWLKPATQVEPPKIDGGILIEGEASDDAQVEMVRPA